MLNIKPHFGFCSNCKDITHHIRYNNKFCCSVCDHFTKEEYFLGCYTPHQIKCIEECVEEYLKNRNDKKLSRSNKLSIHILAIIIGISFGFVLLNSVIDNLTLNYIESFSIAYIIGYLMTWITYFIANYSIGVIHKKMQQSIKY